MTRVDGRKKNKIKISNLIAGGKKCLKLAKSQAGSIQGTFIRRAFVPTSFKIILDIMKCWLLSFVVFTLFIMPDFVVSFWHHYFITTLWHDLLKFDLLGKFNKCWCSCWGCCSDFITRVIMWERCYQSTIFHQFQIFAPHSHVSWHKAPSWLISFVHFVIISSPIYSHVGFFFILFFWFETNFFHEFSIISTSGNTYGRLFFVHLKGNGHKARMISIFWIHWIFHFSIH